MQRFPIEIINLKTKNPPTIYFKASSLMSLCKVLTIKKAIKLYRKRNLGHNRTERYEYKGMHIENMKEGHTGTLKETIDTLPWDNKTYCNNKGKTHWNTEERHTGTEKKSKGKNTGKI